MDPTNPSPEHLQGWNPYAILIICTTLAALVGSAVSWITGKGFVAYVEWSKYRIQLRADRIKARMEEEDLQRKRNQSKQLIDRIIEGNNTVEGYKQLLMVWDDRMQVLENRDKLKDTLIQDLQTKLGECVEKHAHEATRAQGFEERLKEVNMRLDRYQVLIRRAYGEDHPSPDISKQKPE